MADRKYTDEDILRVKAIYMHSRWVLGMTPESSKTVVKAYMKDMRSDMPDGSIWMYCDDAESLESLIVNKRFDKGKTVQVWDFINKL